MATRAAFQKLEEAAISADADQVFLKTLKTCDDALPLLFCNDCIQSVQGDNMLGGAVATIV